MNTLSVVEQQAGLRKLMASAKRVSDIQNDLIKSLENNAKDAEIKLLMLDLEFEKQILSGLKQAYLKK